MKISEITLENIKDHGWDEVGRELGLSKDQRYKTFEYGEYGSVHIIIDENLNIIGGKIIPCGK